MNIVKTKVRADALTVEDLRKIIKNNLKFHKSFITATSMLDDNDLNKFVRTFMDQTPKDDNKFIDEYLKLTKGYSRKADQMEKRVSLSPMLHANRVMIKILEEVEKGLDALFEEKHVNIYTTRISNIMVLNLLRQSDMLSDYCCMLYSEMINLVSKNSKRSTRYRVVFIKDHTTYISTVISNICNKDRAYSFLKDIGDFKKEGNDLLLYADSNPFTKFFSLRRIKDSLGLMGFTLPSINFIAGIANMIDDYHYNKYLQQKDMHEWLVNYTAVLKMELEGEDPDSSEYRRKMAMIEAYETKIDQYAKKIKEAEEGK